MTMLTCRQVTRLLSERMDRGLAPGERGMLYLHLAVCKGCRNVDRQFAFLREAVRRLSGEQAPPR